jgi:hypothetical protein
MNRYTYCGNNPVRYVDPTGHYLSSQDPDDWKAYEDYWKNKQKKDKNKNDDDEDDTPYDGDVIAYNLKYNSGDSGTGGPRDNSNNGTDWSALDIWGSNYVEPKITGLGGTGGDDDGNDTTGGDSDLDDDKVMATTGDGGNKKLVLDPISTSNTAVSGAIGTAVQYYDNAISSLNTTRLNLLMHSRNLRIAALGYFATIDETLVVLGFSDDFARQAQGFVNKINLKRLRLGKLKVAGKALGYAGYAYAGYDI